MQGAATQVGKKTPSYPSAHPKDVRASSGRDQGTPLPTEIRYPGFSSDLQVEPLLTGMDHCQLGESAEAKWYTGTR